MHKLSVSNLLTKLFVVFCLVCSIGATKTLAANSILNELLVFHPTWITRTVSSHDPLGENGDGNGIGLPSETIDGTQYRTLFHSVDEGRITRMWLTAKPETAAQDLQELWILVDGNTFYRGPALDFFEGKSNQFKSPLLLGFNESSGAYTSYLPISYSHEAKVLLSGKPSYFQITYREGQGSSEGPTRSQIETELATPWWSTLEKHLTSSETSNAIPKRIAIGPQTLSNLTVEVAQADLASLKIRIGKNQPVPLSFFFGLASQGNERLDQGWSDVRNAIHFVDSNAHILSTRLPIPLQKGESLWIESSSSTPVHFSYHYEVAVHHSSQVHLVTEFRDQRAPGIATSMEFFKTDKPIQFVSLIEEITENAPGSRLFLEGDEIIRTDDMTYPLHLGTGTEDYFNGGWYFLGVHNNLFSGLTRFNINDPENGWSHASFEHSLYRHHILDPIVSRSGMRFGFEAGENGSFTPARYQTLAIAYQFDTLQKLSQVTLGMGSAKTLTSKIDAESNQSPRTFSIHYSKNLSSISIPCPKDANAVLLTRTYDAAKSNQFAIVAIKGRSSTDATAIGHFFSSYANPFRRWAQDILWTDIHKEDCSNGVLEVTLDSRHSPAPFSIATIDATFFKSTAPLSSNKIEQNNFTHILNTSDIDGKSYYVNDHTFIQDEKGVWHLFGIFHAEPFDPENENEFIHATCHEPNPSKWGASCFQPEADPNKIALQTKRELGETHIWAPHVVRFNQFYWMTYQSGGQDHDRAQIRIAKSSDLNHWERVGQIPLFEDICVARDPMLRQIGELWVLYYTRCNSTEQKLSGVAYRTSLDLLHWSNPKMALVIDSSTPMFNSGYSESPFMFERNGWFYLSLTSYPIEWDATFLYRSHTPFSFSNKPVARLRSHAGEWISTENRFFLSHAGPGQNGVWISPISKF